MGKQRLDTLFSPSKEAVMVGGAQVVLKRGVKSPVGLVRLRPGLRRSKGGGGEMLVSIFGG